MNLVILGIPRVDPREPGLFHNTKEVQDVDGNIEEWTFCHRFTIGTTGTNIAIVATPLAGGTCK